MAAFRESVVRFMTCTNASDQTKDAGAIVRPVLTDQVLPERLMGAADSMPVPTIFVTPHTPTGSIHEEVVPSRTGTIAKRHNAIVVERVPSWVQERRPEMK